MKAEEFKINSLEENTVYVHKNEQKNTYSRVRFIGILGDRKNVSSCRIRLKSITCKIFRFL